jgi:hypothetical protein
MTKTIFITGATSGIGEACARKFAEAKYNIIISGRREDRLELLERELQETYGVKVLSLCFDVQNRKAVFEAVANMPAEWQNIHVLLNNAGLALGKDPFDEADIDDWETMLNTNVLGLLYVTRALLPFIKNAESRHIINMGSIAGKEVYENGNVYCASKSAVGTLSQSMRIDLLKHKIKVTAIHPGAVETEFSITRFKGDAAKADATYQLYTPLYAQDLADTIFYCASLSAHVCINDLVITCLSQAGSHYLYKEG